jgi:hypothetical protein
MEMNINTDQERINTAKIMLEKHIAQNMRARSEALIDKIDRDNIATSIANLDLIQEEIIPAGSWMGIKKVELPYSSIVYDNSVPLKNYWNFYDAVPDKIDDKVKSVTQGEYKYIYAQFSIVPRNLEGGRIFLANKFYYVTDHLMFQSQPEKYKEFFPIWYTEYFNANTDRIRGIKDVAAKMCQHWSYCNNPKDRFDKHEFMLDEIVDVCKISLYKFNEMCTEEGVNLIDCFKKHKPKSMHERANIEFKRYPDKDRTFIVFGED